MFELWMTHPDLIYTRNIINDCVLVRLYLLKCVKDTIFNFCVQFVEFFFNAIRFYVSKQLSKRPHSDTTYCPTKDLSKDDGMMDGMNHEVLCKKVFTK